MTIYIYVALFYSLVALYLVCTVNHATIDKTAKVADSIFVSHVQWTLSIIKTKIN